MTASVESQLDDTAIRILELMNEYIACKVGIESQLRAGCLNLAKSRYINGNRTVSSLQLPTEGDVTASFVLSRTEQPSRYQRLVMLDDEITSRMRKVELNRDADNRTSDESKKRYGDDPLKWFGFLVPQSLRQAKTDFEKCLELVIETMNVQLELDETIAKYKELRSSVNKSVE